jgi:hypothetical protein
MMYVVCDLLSLLERKHRSMVFIPGLKIITTFDWLKPRVLKTHIPMVLLGHITGCN